MLLPSNGVNFLIKINTGSDAAPIFTTLGGQRGASLKLQADETDASSKTSDGWKETIPGLKSWGIEADALVLTDDDGVSTDAAYDKLQECFLNGRKVLVRYTRKDNTAWQGYATIADLSEEAPHDDVATYKITLSGIGKPIKISGAQQVETLNVAGTVTTAGNATVTVTGAGITGSPKALTIAVAINDSAAVVAQKVREALAADTAITTLYTLGGTGTAVTLTRKTAAADDGTLNVAIANGTCAGLTAVPYSANTTVGVAPITV